MLHGLPTAAQLGNEKGGEVDKVPTTRIRNDGETSRIWGDSDTDSSCNPHWWAEENDD